MYGFSDEKQQGWPSTPWKMVREVMGARTCEGLLQKRRTARWKQNSGAKVTMPKLGEKISKLWGVQRKYSPLGWNGERKNTGGFFSGWSGYFWIALMKFQRDFNSKIIQWTKEVKFFLGPISWFFNCRYLFWVERASLKAWSNIFYEFQFYYHFIYDSLNKDLNTWSSLKTFLLKIILIYQQCFENFVIKFSLFKIKMFEFWNFNIKSNI